MLPSAVLAYGELRTRILVHMPTAGKGVLAPSSPAAADDLIHRKFAQFFAQLWQHGSVVVPEAGRRFGNGTCADLRIVLPAAAASSSSAVRVGLVCVLVGWCFF